MPIYRYEGTIPFVSNDYRINVEPGEEFETPYILPDTWENFVLVDASDANALAPSTMPVTLPPGGQVTIPVANYDNLSVVKIAGDGVVNISLIPDTTSGTYATIGAGLDGLEFNISAMRTTQEVKLEAPSTNLGNVEVLVVRSTFDTEPIIGGAASGDTGGNTTLTPSTENMTTRIEYVTGTNDPLYVGYAAPGSDEGDAVWQIRKMEYDAEGRLIAVKFADGELAYNKVWNNRASYSYE